MPSWTGGKDRGPRTYERTERDRVRLTLAQAHGEDKAVAIDWIAESTGLEARTVRAILSDTDGLDGVYAYTADQRVFVAEWREEADGYTTKLEAQVRTMRDRLARRQQASEGLPRRQGGLF